MAFFPNGETSTLWGNKCNKLIQSPQTFVFLSLENQYTCCNYVLRWIPQTFDSLSRLPAQFKFITFPFLHLDKFGGFAFLSPSHVFFLERFHFSFPSIREGEECNPQLHSNQIKCNLIAVQACILGILATNKWEQNQGKFSACRGSSLLPHPPGRARNMSRKWELLTTSPSTAFSGPFWVILLSVLLALEHEKAKRKRWQKVPFSVKSKPTK